MASWASLLSSNLVKICHLKDQPLRKSLGKATPVFSQTPLQEMMLQINHKPKPWDNIARPENLWSPQQTVKCQLEPNPMSQGKEALSCPLTPSAAWQCQTACCEIRVEVDRKTQSQRCRSGRPDKIPAATEQRVREQRCCWLSAPSFQLFSSLTLQPGSPGGVFLAKIFLLLQLFSFWEEKDTFSLSVLNTAKHVKSWCQS